MRRIRLDGKTYEFASSARELKNELIKRNISGNLVKWLGYYDIAVPEQPGRLIPTGIRALYLLTVEEWIELFIKAKSGKL